MKSPFDSQNDGPRLLAFESAREAGTQMGPCLTLVVTYQKGLEIHAIVAYRIKK